ncbi:hypothetical protein GCM10010278_73220 [Streptomyces melanogenes]|nr:hypothetical protein GCM10010278_73220 [Streptomyces melanogenes]
MVVLREPVCSHSCVQAGYCCLCGWARLCGDVFHLTGEEPGMAKHGDGKGGSDGDKQQSPKESDGQWNKPVSEPPKKK